MAPNLPASGDRAVTLAAPSRIAMATSGGPYGRRVLERLHGRGIALDAVLVFTGGLGPPPPAKDEGDLHRLGRWPRSAASAVRRKEHYLRVRRPWYAPRCARVMGTGDLNSRRLRRDLERLAPDYLLTGGGGILPPGIIDTARLGVLNAHPALLPWVRGCGVVGHSLDQGVALGATVHLVDAGIDTGPLVARRLLPVPPGPAALDALEVAAAELAADMLADVVEAIVRRGERPRGVPQDGRRPLCRWPSAAEQAAHEALARSGLAGELFERWAPRCAATATWALPTSAEVSPP
jgi:hypothetical protein